MNYALLLSGGVGLRLQSHLPKQYLRVENKMLVTYSLETLVNSQSVDAVVIVAEEDCRESIIADAKEHGISMEKIIGFARPGNTRQLSVLNGMREILERDGIVNEENAGETDTVLVQDAVRPLVTKKQVEACYLALKNHDGVMPVVSMKDTVYVSEDGGRISELIDRSKLYAGQAPELFRLKKYYRANQSLLPDKINGINGSTEAAIMAGMDILMIPGEEDNFKITTQTDLERFRGIIGKRGER